MFEDQLDQLKEIFQGLAERIQESSLYSSLHERYLMLSPKMQKVLLIAIAIFAVFIVISPPLAKYHTSNENISDFKSRKDIAQKIIQFSKSGSSKLKTPKQITNYDLERTVKDFSKSPVINLNEGQATVRTRQSSKGLLGADQNSFTLVGTELNAEQSLNLAYSLKRYNASLIVTKLTFFENLKRPGYFDTEIHLDNLYTQPISSVLPKPDVSSNSNNKRRNSRRR